MLPACCKFYFSAAYCCCCFSPLTIGIYGFQFQFGNFIRHAAFRPTPLACLAIVDFNLLLFIDKIYGEICINRWTMGPAGATANANAKTNMNVWVWMQMWVWIECGNLDIYCIFGKRRGRGGPPIGAFPLHNDESECIWLQHLPLLPTSSAPSRFPSVPIPSPFWQSPLLLSISAEHFTQLTRFCFCLFWCHQPNGSRSGQGTRVRLGEGLEMRRGRSVIACFLLAMAASIF